jgi:hypothetical protein
MMRITSSAGMPRKTSTYTVTNKRTGLHAGPGKSRKMATTSAHANTITSAIRNTWTLIQNPFNSDFHAPPSVVVDHPKNTRATAWWLVSSSHTRKATMYTDRPIPTAYHDQSRARSPSCRADSISPSLARRAARTECTIAGTPAGGNSKAIAAALR